MSKKIVVIDDEEVIRMLVNDVLSDAGYEVLECEDGKAGIETVKSELPDMIFLDMNMPGMGGSAVSTLLRANDDTKNIPICFLTGYISEEEAAAMDNEMGGKLILTKPFDTDDLLELVKRIVG